MRKLKTHKISEMMKRIIMVVAVCGFLVSPKEIGQAEAQIFILTDEEYLNSNRGAFTGGMVPILPQGGSTDWIYAPLGSGWLLLSGLGTAYLLSKRQKRQKK